MKHSLYTACLLLLSFVGLHGQIFIDDQFSDWTIDKVSFDDRGDIDSGNLDIQSLSIDHDTERIFFRIKLDREISFQENNNLKIYIDLDNNPNTGFSINGIGSEVSYFFGSRYGFVNNQGGSQEKSHDDVGIVSMPTTTGSQFEFCINRTQKYFNTDINASSKISVMLFDDSSNGDKIPNTNGSLVYDLTDNNTPLESTYSFDKIDPSQLRIMSYNVERDQLFSAPHSQHQKRIIQSVNPDIIAFQEIYDNDQNDVKGVLNEILPAKNWQTYKYYPDIIIASAYPILATKAIGTDGGFVLCANESCDEKILIINAHLRCCNNDLERQQGVDLIMNNVRSAKTDPNHALYIESGTPIVILGDMNFVGYRQQLETLRTGDIQNNSSYGPDLNPDWDGSNLIDANPRITDAPYSYTWYNASSSFGPGRLDLMLYTSSAIRLKNSFSLATQFMSASSLAAYNLAAENTLNASDHFALICDFELNPNPIESLVSSIITTNNPTCAGNIDGSIQVSASGGLMPYTYSIDGEHYQAKSEFFNLTEGTYTLYVKDLRENIRSISTTLVAPDAINIEASHDESSLTISASGGTPPYTYSLNGNEYTSTTLFENIERGTLSIYVKDANNCIQIVNYELDYIIDEDMDGYDLADDCNDMDPNINPSAEEIPGNNIDENCDGLDIITQVLDLADLGIEIYPNPFLQRFIIHNTSNKSYDIRVLDNAGMMIRTFQVRGKNKITIPSENWSSGIYHLHIGSDNQTDFTIHRLVKL